MNQLILETPGQVKECNVSVMLGQIMGFCLLINESKKLDAFFDLSGHVESLGVLIKLHKDGVGGDYRDYTKTYFKRNVYYSSANGLAELSELLTELQCLLENNKGL